MSNIRQEIKDNIYNNSTGDISGGVLQRVLLAMVDRDVFLSESEYNALVEHGMVDEDKIYHIYEDE